MITVASLLASALAFASVAAAGDCDWDAVVSQGRSTISQGQRLVAEGNRDIRQGQASIQQGRSDISQGQRLVAEGNYSQGYADEQQGTALIGRGRALVRQAKTLTQQGKSVPAVSVLCRWLKPNRTLVCLAKIGSTRRWFSLQDQGSARALSANPTNLSFTSGPPLATGTHWLSLTGVQCDHTAQALTCGSLITRHGFAVSAAGQYTTF